MLATKLNSPVDLSIVIPALAESENLEILLPSLISVLNDNSIRYEVIVVDCNPDQSTIEVTEKFGARLIDQQTRGYGKALILGFAAAQGTYILTMDADLSHPFEFVKDLWDKRNQAEVVIASRYVPSARPKMPIPRYFLSRVLNVFFARGLSLPIRDMSSGFRLYKASVIQSLSLESRDFDIVQEILVKVFCEGWQILELPFNYAPRRFGRSRARIIAFGIAYLRTFMRLYSLRNSIASADYDDRAYDSIVLPQRYWQRQRFYHITSLIHSQGATLDVGCGSSRIIAALPQGSVAVDILLRKVRYARKFGKRILQGSGFHLPFRDESFQCVLCSQVIEHVPKNSTILDELCRVLAPGGLLVLGTPDYANWQWNLIEAIYAKVLPSAYADEHISHYTKQELLDLFAAKNYRLADTRYILQGELILALYKPADQTGVHTNEGR